MKKRIIGLLTAVCVLASTFATLAFTVFGSGGSNSDADGAVLDTAYNAAAQKLDDDYGYTEYDLGTALIDTSYGETMRFRLWSPTAEGVKLNIFTTGTNYEPGATKIGSYTLEKLHENGKWTGVWEVRLVGNWQEYYYTYSVTYANKTAEIADPYSRQLSNDGKRSYTIDFDHKSFKPNGWDSDSHVYFDSVSARTVYRLDVAGYTGESVSGIKNSGKFLGLTETGTHYADSDYSPSTGLDHIKQLGVTAVELDGVLDLANAAAVNINRGTKQENAVSELRQLISKLHSEGLTVIIKLPAGFVKADNGAFDGAVPNYYFRLDEAGGKLDGSGFGNELASERLMYRNWLITTLLGWVNEYHIDGFSVEQSALIDADTLSAAVAAVKAVDDRIAFFADGECKAVNSHPSTVCTGETFRRATRANSAYLPSTLNFEERSEKSLYAEICEELGVSSASRNETAVKKAKLAAGLLALSTGTLYIDAGDEMCAAALGGESFNWGDIKTYFDVFSYYRGLLQLRATFPYFASDGLSFRRGNVLSASDSGNRLVTSHDPNSWKAASISYNATDEQVREVALCDLRDWDIVASSNFAGLDSRDKVPEGANNYFTLDAYSINVAVDSASFASAGFSSGMEALTIEFVKAIDDYTDEKIAPDMILAGKSGEGYFLPNRGEPRLGNGYELYAVRSYASGKFGETTRVTCEYKYIFDGIKDGGEYCSSAKFKLKDIENVYKVQLDGVTLTPDNGTYTLTGSGEHTVNVETKDGSHTVKVKLRSDHNYQFVTENGTYYKKCSECGFTTEPQAIPSVEITAPARVCAGQDCVVTVGALPSGVTVDGGFYEFEFMGSEIDVHETNGVWSGTVSHEWYQPDADKFDVGIGFKTADGYFFTVKKTIKVLAQHTGGTATCTKKAKCEVCGESYGSLDANNHTGKAEWVKDAQGHEKKYTCCGAVTVARAEHDYTFVTENGTYYKKCSTCGHTTSPQAIPSVEITAPARVCAGQDCVVTVGALPDGVTVDGGFYEFELMGSEIDVHETNGVWSGTVSHGWYQSDADKFDVGIGFRTADGYFFTVKKTVKVLSEHTGGTATCTKKAKCEVCGESYGSLDANNHTGKAEWIKDARGHEKKYTCCGAVTVARAEHDWRNGECKDCGYACAHSGGKATCTEKAKCEVCGESYGSLDANNHSGLVRVEAKAATATSEGNIEYRHCSGCDKYYSDAAATKPIAKADTVIKRLEGDLSPSPKTGDSALPFTAAAMLMVSALTAAAVVCGKKKRAK